MNIVECYSVIDDAAGELSRGWGITAEAAVDAMSKSALALGLHVEDLAALVAAWSRLQGAGRPVLRAS